jgi:hypothetical protein
MRSRRTALPLLLATTLCLPGLPAAATSYVPMTDEALVAQAPLALVVKIVKIGGAGSSSREGGPATDYTARVERVLKGDLTAREITVRVPGGIGPDGIGLRIWGAPVFVAGERALLFLVPQADRSYVISQLMLGAFHQVYFKGRSGGQRFAVRDLSEAQPVVPRGWKVPAEPLRDFDRFAAWVSRPHRIDYLVQADPRLLHTLTAPFTLATGGDLVPLRWFVFDSAGSASFLFHQNGQPGLAGGGLAEFQAALAAWTADAGTSIACTYGGTTTNTNGLNTLDGVNTILFEQNLNAPYSCGQGGVLAQGKAWFSTSLTAYHGQSYHAIVEGDIAMNAGISCFFTGNPNAGKAAEEIFGHELGHTLGLGHSCETVGSCSGQPDLDAALMRSMTHNDGRGAQLNVDDRTAIAVLYTPAAASPAANFFTVTPCRLLDTRSSTGGGPLSVNQTKTLSVLGLCGIPSTATSIVGNITAVSPTGAGTLTLAPASAGVTGTSSVSFNPGNTRASQALIGLSGVGSRAFTIRNGLMSGTVDVIVDVTGYFQ